MQKKIILCCSILLLLSVMFVVFYKTQKKNEENSALLNQYQEKSQRILKENQLTKSIQSYNKTLDVLAASSYFQKEYFEDYQKINYVQTDSFAEKINILLNKNYTPDEINQAFEYLSDKNIKKLLDMEYVSLKNFFSIPNLDVEKINSYLSYQNAKEIPLKDAVTQVNLHLDQEFYTNIETVSDPNSITVLVNKFHALPKDYVPDDLVNVGNTSYRMRKEAANSLEKLIAAAELEGRILIPYSTYRSYDYQNNLYEMYKKREPIAIVDTYSARPGHSEHQTGLACDLRSAGLSSDLADSDYTWMLDHSYQYGFIVRYPKNQSTITGYQEEPWHIRYIGIEHATKVHNMKITFDEYYDLYLEQH